MIISYIIYQSNAFLFNQHLTSVYCRHRRLSFDLDVMSYIVSNKVMHALLFNQYLISVYYLYWRLSFDLELVSYIASAITKYIIIFPVRRAEGTLLLTTQIANSKERGRNPMQVCIHMDFIIGLVALVARLCEWLKPHGIEWDASDNFYKSILTRS